jgi:prophage DNA circulation protein
MATWLDYLQTASWQGVPFGVFQSERTGGRKVAVHDYPFRDDVWPEDIGLARREFRLRGFLTGDDCAAQEDAMHAVCGIAGAGILVHPTLGAITVSLTTFSSSISWERGGVVELQFTFIRGATSAIFPSAITDALSAISDAADVAELAAAGDYGAALALVGASGGSFVSTAVGLTGGVSSAVGSFVASATKVAGDAAIVTSAVSGLAGNNGRYSNGSLAAGLNPSATVSTVLAGVTTSISAIGAAGAAAKSLAALV